MAVFYILRLITLLCKFIHILYKIKLCCTGSYVQAEEKVVLISDYSYIVNVARVGKMQFNRITQLICDCHDKAA